MPQQQLKHKEVVDIVEKVMRQAEMLRMTGLFTIELLTWTDTSVRFVIAKKIWRN